MPDTHRFDTTLAEASAEFPRNTEGSVARLNDGRLLAAWTAFEAGTGDSTPAHIRGRTSGDHGTTWSESFVLLENVATLNTMSVSLLRERSGGLLMAVLEKESHTECRLTVRRAMREPDVWSRPTIVTREPCYHVMNNDRLYEDTAGRIYAPVSVTCGEIWSDTDHFACRVWFSDDGGRSWNASRTVIDLPARGAMEPGIIETEPRTLLMIIRSQLGEIHRSVSKNAGWTWSPPEPLGVASPESPATVGHLPDGRLALVYNPDCVNDAGHGGPRTPLRVAVSNDVGLSWKPVRDLETNSSKTYAYTSWYLDGDHVFLTYYVRDEVSKRLSLKLVRLGTPWFDSNEL